MFRKVNSLAAITISCACLGGMAMQAAHADAARKEIIHRSLADIYEKLGEAPQAMEQYQALAQLCPTDSGIQVAFGTLLARQKEYRLAVEHYRKAVSLNPSGDNYGALGDGLFWARDYKGACDAYARAGARWNNKLQIARQYYQNQVDQQRYNQQMKDRD